ncbi:MAG TPA: hypothetical protein DCM23_02830 [Firmicutes bacterium]|nr:hypothetical protein [Bacillota bacterium]
MPKITLDQVTKYYVDDHKTTAVAALFKVSAEIPDGSLAVIVGPSGCGKTTLLKTIAGIYELNEGVILFNDQDIAPIAISERNLSFVNQEFALYPNMTSFENIAYPLKVAHIPIEETRKRVQEVATLLEIELLLSRKPRVLSGGQRQLVALARALIKRPHILLLDEPFANIDDPTRQKLRKIIKDIKARYNMNVIMSTHRQEDAYFLADQLIEMNNGEIVKVTAFEKGLPV